MVLFRYLIVYATPKKNEKIFFEHTHVRRKNQQLRANLFNIFTIMQKHDAHFHRKNYSFYSLIILFIAILLVHMG